MASDLGAFTDTWMANPWMFDPSQQSNRFSNYNNAPLPYPPTYNDAYGPVNAATGKPIQSYQDWKAANPAGVTINQTPAQPQAAPTQNPFNLFGGSPNAAAGSKYAGPYSGGTLTGLNPYDVANLLAGGMNINLPPAASQQQTQPQAQAQPQASGPPNNWQAALNALSNPGNPVTQGANVPLVSGYQPSGGVNQAFLGQAMGQPGRNQNFLSALNAIQGRPQGSF